MDSIYRLDKELPGFEEDTIFKFVDKQGYFWLTPTGRWEKVSSRLIEMIHEALAEQWLTDVTDAFGKTENGKYKEGDEVYVLSGMHKYAKGRINHVFPFNGVRQVYDIIYGCIQFDMDEDDLIPVNPILEVAGQQAHDKNEKQLLVGFDKEVALTYYKYTNPDAFRKIGGRYSHDKE